MDLIFSDKRERKIIYSDKSFQNDIKIILFAIVGIALIDISFLIAIPISWLASIVIFGILILVTK
ncbi:MAG: hypothetical protein ACPGVD_07180 [Flavobacteriales bacterium]